MKDILRNKNGLTEDEFLKDYAPEAYERPSVTVDTLIFTITDKPNEDIRKLDEKELKVLLIKRNDHPYMGKWAFPGGFVKIDESLDHAVDRMVKEETNISNIYFEQLYTYGDVNRDPRMRVLSVAYMALVPQENIKPVPGRDTSMVQWFIVKREKVNEDKWILRLLSEDGTIEMKYEVTEKQVKRGVTTSNEISVNPKALTEESLAFDHYNILTNALERMKNKIEYTPIAFNLVGEYFTRAEIQSIYELILDRQFTRVEMWRMIKDRVVETEYTSAEKGHRPAKYYKFLK